jgi:hypothetical protein
LFNPAWSLRITNTAGGSVMTEPALALVTNGSHVVATAIANDAYGFRGWNGTITSTANPLDFFLNTNVNLVAEFGRLLNVALRQAEGGSVTILPEHGPYMEGDTLRIEAAANEGFRFQAWKEPLQAFTNGGVITLTNDIAVEAIFKKLQAVLVTQTGEGTVTGLNGLYYDIGEEITLSAQAKTNWFFTGWSGSVTNASNPLILVVSTNTSVNAIFKQLFTLTATSSEGGVVEMTPMASNYVDGTIVTLLAKPNRYYRLEQWTGGVTGTNNPVAVAVTNNLEVLAVFAPSHRLGVGAEQDLTTGFWLLVDGEPGVAYVIETSSGLVAWTPLITITNSGGPVQYLDKQARSISRRFYRLRPENP